MPDSSSHLSSGSVSYTHLDVYKRQPYWSENVSSSFGIYDQPLPGLGIEMNVNDWESTITNAMQVAPG